MGPAQPHQHLLKADNYFYREHCQAVTPSPAKELKELRVSAWEDGNAHVKIAKIMHMH